MSAALLREAAAEMRRLEVVHSTYPEALAVARVFLGRDT